MGEGVNWGRRFYIAYLRGDYDAHRFSMGAVGPRGRSGLKMAGKTKMAFEIPFFSSGKPGTRIFKQGLSRRISGTMGLSDQADFGEIWVFLQRQFSPSFLCPLSEVRAR